MDNMTTNMFLQKFQGRFFHFLNKAHSPNKDQQWLSKHFHGKLNELAYVQITHLDDWRKHAEIRDQIKCNAFQQRFEKKQLPHKKQHFCFSTSDQSVIQQDSPKIKYETCVSLGQIAIEESLCAGPLSTKYGTVWAKDTRLFYCGSLFKCQVAVFDIYYQKSFYSLSLRQCYAPIWTFMKDIKLANQFYLFFFFT